MNKAISFLKQSVAELKKSTWLTRKEVVQSTILVAIVVALVAAYVSIIDFGLTTVLGLIVGGRECRKKNAGMLFIPKPGMKIK